MDKTFFMKPEEIEKRSFEIITEKLSEIMPLYKDNSIEEGIKALKEGALILSDTNMTKSGINKKALLNLNCTATCFMSDEDVAESARINGTTRAWASMDKAVNINGPLIITIGNAPTALIRVHQLIKEERIKPKLIIGVPVGFVNVIESKQLFLEDKISIPYIISKGNKGGSTVSASIINALMYEALKF